MGESLINLAVAPSLLLVALRVVGIFLVAPVLSHAAMPVRLRIAMSIVVAVAVVGRLPAPVTAADSAGLLLAQGAMELMIGLAIGYAARLIFAGVELAAGYIGQQMGVALIEALNPTSEDDYGTVRRLFEMLAIVIFLAIGGHRALIAGLLGTFDAAPVAGLAGRQSLLAMMVGLLGSSFVLAIKVAAPVLVALLLTTLAMAMLGRTIPQLNFFAVGLTVQVMLGLLVLSAALAVLGPLVQQAWTSTQGQLGSWLGGQGHP